MNSKNNEFQTSASPTIEDDIRILELMLQDSRKQPSIYQPGKYWFNTAKNATKEIKKFGIRDFRGSANLIGLSYADNLLIDIRNTLNYSLKSKLAKLLTRIYPIGKIFDSQVNWTESYAKKSLLYASEVLNLKERTKCLLNDYIIPYSILGNCLSKAKINSQEYSIHYLNLLEQHDNISKYIDFSKARSIFEIGGGFGANIHLLLQNYKNIKKVLYLDIPPNLYVGTQYLKAFYGSSVYDYHHLRNIDPILFSSDDNLQIFCITPWQIEKFKNKIDIFLNSHSFVEMPPFVVQNYCDKFKKFPNYESAALALISYDGFDLNTINPSKLPDFFENRNFEFFEKETLLDSFRKNLYFISPGRLAYK